MSVSLEDISEGTVSVMSPGMEPDEASASSVSNK